MGVVECGNSGVEALGAGAKVAVEDIVGRADDGRSGSRARTSGVYGPAEVGRTYV